MGQQSKQVEETIAAAIDLIGSVPGYQATAEILSTLWKTGRIRYSPTFKDRGGTDWLGHITIGQEAIDGGIIGLAETLVHEQFHRTQPLLAKPASFWTGVLHRSPVWRRLELPAYRAATDFLLALERYALANNKRHLAEQARHERGVVILVFQALYGIPLDV